VPTDVTIGDFSRMTHLTVKTLRHYHQVGLLEPADVDPRTGYRYYSTDQVPAAHLIRRFRDLDMPIDEVRAVLAAPDRAARDRLVAAHLDRLQQQLEHTQAAVESLRDLLGPGRDGAGRIEHRAVGPLDVLAISATVPHREVGRWWTEGLSALRSTVAALGRGPDGPAGGLYATELFAEEQGDATLYLPVDRARSVDLPPGGPVRATVVPAAHLAVVVHYGTEDGIDLAYGELGVYVAEHGIAVDGPIRETYLVDRSTTTDATRWRTEVGWPIAPGAPAPPG
jgi:DNA-binding transcriptional MerR regulator/effector-binding domain-containing protein